MTKLVSTLAIVVLGLVALGAVGPRIAQLMGALVPLVLVVGITAACCGWCGSTPGDPKKLLTDSKT
jgi:hypothetical protein